MLGVDRVVLDRGVEPQPVALVAVVERALERLALAPASPAPPAAAAAALGGVALLGLGAGGVVVIVGRLVVGRFVIGRRLVLLGLERRRDEGVVLGPEIELVRAGGWGGIVSVAGVRGEVVLALETLDVRDGHVELMRDPRVGATLTHPRTDLIQLGL